MHYERGDWYDQYIEDPLKGIVRYLRNNGVNTELSCGHEMYIHCQFTTTTWTLEDLRTLVYVYLSEHPGDLGFDGISFTIDIRHSVIDSRQNTDLVLKFPKKEKTK